MSNVIENGNYCVYIHTSPSGKKYVGQTGQKPEKRWGKDGSHYLKKEKNGEYMHIAFARAILKYGWDNIEHEIVASNLTKEEADNFEKLLIEKLNTKNRKYGYNLKDGGLGGGGFSEETLKKMSESHKGKKQSEEAIRKRVEKLIGINNPNYGKHLSEETKQKIKESRKWYTPSEETRKKMSDLFKGEGNPNYGKAMSEEQKKKLSEANMGKTHSEDTKKKISEATKGENNPFYGKKHSEESIKKMSESHNGSPVVQYDSQGNLIKIWNCVSEAARSLGIAAPNIYKACKGERKTVGGFVWKRYENIEMTA